MFTVCSCMLPLARVCSASEAFYFAFQCENEHRMKFDVYTVVSMEISCRKDTEGGE